MIKDNIKYAACYPELAEVLAELCRLDENTPTGQLVINENVRINVGEVENAQKEGYLFEAHRDYIDVHYVLCGEEKLAYAEIDKMKTAKEYNPDADCEMLEGEGEIITLGQGDFCVTFPQDAHAPFVGKSDFLKKAVAKIKIGK